MEKYTKKELCTLVENTGVSRFLEFSEEEKEYLKAACEGEYKPELLFDEDISGRIHDNPAAKFYIQNRIQQKST